MANRYTRPFITLGVDIVTKLLRRWLEKTEESPESLQCEGTPQVQGLDTSRRGVAEKAELNTNVGWAARIKSLKFGEATGLLVKPAERGGIVVLLPPNFGEAKKVYFEGPRSVLHLEPSGFANPHQGQMRQHWRRRGVAVTTLNRKLGRVGSVYLVVDGYRVLVPKPLNERSE